MPDKFAYDAVVVGSGPNGLAAAIRVAQANLSVLLLEAKDQIGGGTRSGEITLAGFVHDLCSAIHPMALGSPFFRKLPLEKYGLTWIQPEFPLAHPLDGGTAVILRRSVDETANGLGIDSSHYRKWMCPLLPHWENLADEFLQPMLHIPKHPLQLARFGLRAFRSATGCAHSWFDGEPARALFAGLAAHSFLPLEELPSAAFGMVLGLMGHAVGWPVAKGGSQRIADALAAHLRALGGEIRTNSPVEKLQELPPARAVLLDVTPLQLLEIAGGALPSSYVERLGKFRYGPGVFKVDYALSAPIPWGSKECGRAGTVHLGGTLSEIAESEKQMAKGQHPGRPFVLLAQPTLFDPSRAPDRKHIAWAYCHVPNGSNEDMLSRIEDQIERFAPGFRRCVIARHTMNCAAMEQRNPNLVGGDINGGLANLRQLIARPTLSLDPYRTGIPGLYLCSSSTPPGGGVHGMCGFHAAETAIRDCFSTRHAHPSAVSRQP
jgi:phytoene dehydrogenase-like protein